MRWIYEVEWLDGRTEEIPSSRLSHLRRDDRNMVIEVNEHGHDRRFDEILIPLGDVRRVHVREVQ